MLKIKVTSLIGMVTATLILLSGLNAQAQDIPIPDYSIANSAQIDSLSLKNVADSQHRNGQRRKSSVKRPRRTRNHAATRTRRNSQTRSTQRSHRSSYRR